MADKLYHGCRIKRSDYDNGVGVAVLHPVKLGSFIAAFDDVALVVDDKGRDEWGYQEVLIVDEAREKWDALPSALREVLLSHAHDMGKKIAAIKALRSVTDLGLTDAKRAIEGFTV
jgi:ribosomal protein L7/L12